MAQIRERKGKRDIRYMAVVRREGQSRTATFHSKTEAKERATSIESAIDKGEPLPLKESKRKSLRDLLIRYISNHIPKKNQRNPERIANFLD